MHANECMQTANMHTPAPKTTTTETKVPRRTWLTRALQVTAGLGGLGLATLGYSMWEAAHIRVRRQTVALPHLPRAFRGTTIAVMADFHHGPLVSLRFIRQSVSLAQSLHADAYALVGDFAHHGTHTTEQLPPCLEAVEKLRAPLGVFAVPGNHDMQRAGEVYRELVSAASLTDLTNRSVGLQKGRETLWLGGVDDLYWGRPNLSEALSGVPDRAAVVLLCHNPDYAELEPDPRVGLMLSGHTHGGQIYLPGYGATWIPSRFGEKYRVGLVQGPASQVFVSRGLGESGVPLRFNCPPEINLLTLVSPTEIPS